jgi:hypothetical protein
VLENHIKAALDSYGDAHAVGRWSKSNVGIGPVIAAGLLAHIDITKARTATPILRFAGLDPTVKWHKGQRRPWNDDLKTLCWKIGESFVKFSGHKDDTYGKLYLQRKAIEVRNNLEGQLSDQARQKLAEFNIGKDTDAYAWYSGSLTPEDAVAIAEVTKRRKEPGSGLPMLPPAHIHARAKRWTVKLFLSHWQQVAYREHYHAMAPAPYVFAHKGHVDHIDVPNWPFSGPAPSVTGAILD